MTFQSFVFKLIIASLVFYSCQHSEKPITSEKSRDIDSVQLRITAQHLYDSLQNPWGMAWLPDGRLLVTEKAGEILVFKNDKFTGEKLSGVPQVTDAGQGGLL